MVKHQVQSAAFPYKVKWFPYFSVLAQGFFFLKLKLSSLFRQWFSTTFHVDCTLYNVFFILYSVYISFIFIVKFFYWFCITALSFAHSQNLSANILAKMALIKKNKNLGHGHLYYIKFIHVAFKLIDLNWFSKTVEQVSI